MVDSGKYDFLPYFCIHIDADYSHFKKAICQSITCKETREELCHTIQSLWSASPNFILPCLSVRSGLDLYLQVQNYPPGSEIIMSAINIPQLTDVVHHHGLKIVSLDISIATISPKMELFESLISSKTVAVLVAHIYGKEIEMEPILRVAKQHKISVIEDCAECFRGLKHLSHPESDLALYSFGTIKFFTSFGGGVAIVKDEVIRNKMTAIQSSYPVQSSKAYVKKVLQYCLMYSVLTTKPLTRFLWNLFQVIGCDYQSHAVKMLRSFPQFIIENIRQQPSKTLLAMMVYRHSTINLDNLRQQHMKGEYVLNRLPPEIEPVGKLCEVNNFWLFPIIVENPDMYVATLKAMGVDAYRGATQLNLVESDSLRNRDSENMTDKGDGSEMSERYLLMNPHEAKYLIDHVVYLPVNKNVPYPVLDEIIKRAKIALSYNQPHNLHNVRPVITSKL